MRLTLGGNMVTPLVLMLNRWYFDKTEYVEQGYTNFDVMCIGAAGGYGGGLAVPTSTPKVRVYGGAPGGGGVHRMRGLLSQLPIRSDVTVGAPGEDAPDNTTRTLTGLELGEDGGASSFADGLCRASGGKGGGKAQGINYDSAGGLGGLGGIGNSITAGGGMVDYWDGSVGSGGRGGNGGSADWDASSAATVATDGARGAYNVDDQSVSGPAGLAGNDPINNQCLIIPGPGGGANINELTGMDAFFGSRAQGCDPSGLVIIRLTAGLS